MYNLVDNLMAYTRLFAKEMEPDIMIEAYITVTFNEDLVI